MPSRFEKPTIIGIIVFALLWLPASGNATQPAVSDERLSAIMVGSPADEPDGAAERLVFVSARYEVDVLGSIATGMLVQEFHNDTEHDLEVSYRLKTGPSIRTGSITYETDGEARDGALPEEEEKPESEPAAGGAGGTKKTVKEKPASGDTRGGAVRVRANKSVTVRTRFTVEVPLDTGQSRLRLPAIYADQVPVARPRAVRRQAPRALDRDTRPQGGPDIVPMSISVNVHHDERLLDYKSRTHDIIASFDGEKTIIEPARMEIVDGKPFELMFSYGSEYDATLLAYAGPLQKGTRQVVLVLTPPSAPWKESIRAKQVLFVLDTSGSMRHGKLDQARRAIAACLRKLDRNDLYNIVEFDSQATMLRAEPGGIATISVSEAETWLESLEAAGGTMLLPALKQTLQQPESRDHHPMIVVLTDGMMVDEEEVVELLEQNLGSGRLFVVGIGKDVKRSTIRRLAEYGRGTAAFAVDAEAIDRVVETLFDSVASPLAWDLEVDWGAMTVDAVQPLRLPDLYAGRTVKAIARVSGDLPEEMTIRGFTTDGEQTWVGTVHQLRDEQMKGVPAPRKAPAQKTARKKAPESRP